MSNLYVSETESPYRRLKLPDDTWISSDTRFRVQLEKLKLFIQATSWRQPKSGLGCFSDSINGPETWRIRDYI